VKDRVFLDTNVLLYADDADAGIKRDRAQSLIGAALRSGNGVLSTQILQEYFVNATRKLGLEAAQARERIEVFRSFDIITVREEHILGAIDLHRLQSFSFWDALVLKTAAESGCERLLTEDLQHGQRVESLSVENPFL
jgi:predicted nucleic acid-binding protein